MQLYDDNGDIYYLWLSSSIHSYLNATAAVNTLYDDNTGATAITYDTATPIGNRFNITITSSTNPARIDVALTIDGKCDVNLYMISQGNKVNGRDRMHYLHINPPECYRCFICGLCGDFERVSSGAEWEQMETCDGGFVSYRAGWSSTITEAYDINGWTYERSYVEANCALPSEPVLYGVSVGDNFTYVSPCDASIESQVITECAAAKTAQSTCCDLIGNGYCDQLQTNCELDACVASGTNASVISGHVESLFTNPVNFTCNLPNVAALYDATNLEVSVNASGTVMVPDCFDIDGGNWTLVRHAYNQWHPATDNLNGTDEYGTYDNHPQSMSSWSIPFRQYLWSDGSTEFMFSNGDCSKWLITTNDQFTTSHVTAYSANILSSYTSATSYTARWSNRQYDPVAYDEDPWISVGDHAIDLLYGEADNEYFPEKVAATTFFNVWIRILPTRNPTATPTKHPSSSPTVTKHWVQIATENAGAGPTAIWRHLAFDFYSQYPAESIAAYRLEFNGDPGSYTNVLTFELDDKSLNLFNDSATSLADYHSIHVLESTLAPIPVGNHYFCKQCATSRTDLVADTCWAVTPLSDPRRQSDLGCNLDGWQGSGVYYGSQDCPICHKGAFAGYKANLEQKGGLLSVGVRLSILVETLTPTATPTTQPTSPTINPSVSPTNQPSLSPTNNPSTTPSANPSISPSAYPSVSPTNQPSSSPTNNPSTTPTVHPSSSPTPHPSKSPLPAGVTHNPTITPTAEPSVSPSNDPTVSPSSHPTTVPTDDPSVSPSNHPSVSPSESPSSDPSSNPSVYPSLSPTIPSLSPTNNPSTTPTADPSSSPTPHPSKSPLPDGVTHNPTVSPSNDPTLSPSDNPTTTPTGYPSVSPSNNPSVSPSESPSSDPSSDPTQPSESPTYIPSSSPTLNPSNSPSDPPSLSPTIATQFPSVSPTQNPTLSVPIKRHFMMVLTGNFEEFERYLNNTNVTKVVWAKGLVRKIINVAIYPQLANVIIIINSVRKGSVIIDYSLEVNVISLLDLAEQNINSTVEISVHANLTMPIASNTKYTLNPTTNPTAAPTTSAPSQSPTMKPTKPPLKPAETHHPSTAPTKEPSGFPTTIPTYDPTTSNPTTDPTISPTSHPTKAPTPQDIECNHAGIATETDGAYEYYLHIDETSIVRFDTCHTLSLFDIFIVDTNDTDKTYGCVECGSICLARSQYQVTLSAGKYRMDIDGPHAFKMICISKPDTDAPTSSPTTSKPTKTPTEYPSVNPTTSRPTEPEYPVFNVSFTSDGGAPISRHTFLGDPYGRFEAFIEIEVYDAESVLGVTTLCTECFVWQYRLENGVWTDISYANNDDISVYNQQVTTVEGRTTFHSRLTIQSIRRLNAGRCVDEDDNSRLFTPGNVYELRLQFVVDREYFLSSISNALSIETNTLPSGGFCVIQDFENLEALKPYNLFCDEWDNEDNLEYNALLKDVLMSKSTFADDARKLRSVAPVGNVSIIVMIKEQNVDNAITCYPIHAAFKRIADTIHDKLNQNTSQKVNASTIVKDILHDVASITNTTSYSENPDVAVSIVTVIEDIYAENLTTQNEAAMIVDGIVSNILDGSGVLDIVINVQNNSDNISWVVLEGEDIISELATISSITSNEDIVDAETTTTVLVDAYLPQIFEAIDVFVEVNTRDNKTSNDQLYNIAGQSQQLIENLESTLQATLDAVTVVRDDVSIINETEVAQVVENLNNLAQSLVDYATLAASKALSQSDVGETFNYETTEYNEDGTIQNTKTIIATKFDANIIDFNDSNLADEDIILPKCGNEHQNIELPLSFMKQQDGVFDCAFMASSRNNFISNQERNQTSNTVSINIYNDDSKPNVYESNACFPYLITMGLLDFDLFDDYHDMSLGDEFVFPSCDFWNVSDSLWDTAGCFVYNISNSTVTCGCTHLTTFSISQDAIVPEANILTEIDWKEFTFHNLYTYPTVWLTCLLFFVVFIFICRVSPIICDKIQTRSIMSYEDIIYKSVQEEKLWKDISGKEIKYITDYMPNQHLLGRGLKTVAPNKEARRSVCRLQWKLYSAYLRNDHTLLSVFQRTAGTNFSLNQRLGCFFMYLCNIMVVTGTFYGLEQSTPVQDVLASFIISLCGTLPVLVIRKLFEKSKPLEVKSTKHVLDDTGTGKKIADLDDYDSVDVDSPSEGSAEGQADITTMVSARASAAWNDWDMGEFMQRGDLTIRDFNAQITKLYDQDNKEHKIRAISDIRKALFDKMFPLNHVFKKVGWIVLILWSLAACVTAIVYGFKFDIDARAIENTNNPNAALYEDNDCWNTTLALQLEADLSKQAFMNDYVEQQVKNAASYAGGDAKSWLLSIFQSLLTSMILWQPLTVYVVTWFKIWMFSWHLKMQVGPGNVILLCKRCCCGYDMGHLDEDDPNNKGQKSKMKMLSQYLSRSKKKSETVERRSSHKIRDVVANKNRPVDIISFLGNEEWIIDDTKEIEVNVNQDERNTRVELQPIIEKEKVDDTVEITSDLMGNEGAGARTSIVKVESFDYENDEEVVDDTEKVTKGGDEVGVVPQDKVNEEHESEQSDSDEP